MLRSVNSTRTQARSTYILTRDPFNRVNWQVANYSTRRGGEDREYDIENAVPVKPSNALPTQMYYIDYNNEGYDMESELPLPPIQREFLRKHTKAIPSPHLAKKYQYFIDHYQKTNADAILKKGSLKDAEMAERKKRIQGLYPTGSQSARKATRGPIIPDVPPIYLKQGTLNSYSQSNAQQNVPNGQYGQENEASMGEG